MNTPILETHHTTIKLMDENHVSLLCDYYTKNKSHLKSWEPIRDKIFYTEKHWQIQASDSLTLFLNKQAIKFVALNKSETQIIATCNFSNIVFGCFDACHLGYSIDKDFEGKGIMYEVIMIAISYIKDEFKLHRIMANHIPNNTRSEKLLTKLGFEKEGLAKSYLKINGQWQDHILNSLILPTE